MNDVTRTAALAGRERGPVQSTNERISHVAAEARHLRESLKGAGFDNEDVRLIARLWVERQIDKGRI